MLLLLLLPHMEHELAKGYADVLKSPPMLYPYYVDVVNTERLNGFRGFSLRIVLDAVPTVGPHIAVGEDKFTFDISPIADVKLVRYEHVKGPDPSSFPPNYKDLLK
ncbi:DUF3888 domain-containing protein [Paenibacillus lycopersici]|uniref:DUF3888 domain-containing protein n=2 Tax=Paenibacillus lycopersici TaxID=2704462 RepID=A0A6C0G8Q9_9BACL|nr:DUF3888 domain-containing protein [Paenibacillus lycopersici]